jgi:heme-degrading monooxygenase HmoA
LISARIAKFCFKNGKREEAFEELNYVLTNIAANSKGFRGFVSLVSNDDKNVAVIMTLWEDEESLTESEKTIFSPAIEKINYYLEKAPEVEHFRLHSEMYLRRS